MATFDPGNQFSVPYMGGTVGIVVNTKVIKELVMGYKDVFQPSHKGRIVVVDDPREIVTWAFEANGLPINVIQPTGQSRAGDLVTTSNVAQRPNLVGSPQEGKHHHGLGKDSN